MISSSPGELQPVAAAMLANATRICEANLGVFHLYEAGAFPVVAMQGATPEFAERHRREPMFRPVPEAPLGRARRDQRGRTYPRHAGGASRDARAPQPVDGCQNHPQRPHAQGQRAGGRDCDLSNRGAPVHRQTDRAGAEFRSAGRHRNREHAAAQRAAGILAAADRHRRCAQGYQPFDLRPASCARHADRISCPPVRSRHGLDQSPERRRLPAGRQFRSSSRAGQVHGNSPA